MTEDQARTKWCPHVRYGDGGDDVATNRCGKFTSENHEWARCIASDCMMWRWGERHTQEPIKNSFLIQVTALPKEEWKGSCGLTR